MKRRLGGDIFQKREWVCNQCTLYVIKGSIDDRTFVSSLRLWLHLYKNCSGGGLNSSRLMTISRARDVGLPLMNIVRLKAMSILQQLHLEERLLRTSSDNWCIINDGTNASTIVMGVSGKPSELIELETVVRDRIPVIRRFTGGGTVIVDGGTVFVTFICNKDAIPGLQPYPRPIMSWTGQLYGEVLQRIGDFRLRENDYVFGNCKFGGNAQSITKYRWIHHTSFLWDYDVRNMAYLKQPIRVPEYRLATDKAGIGGGICISA
ncbi:biotin/lipoate A/B protein ligase family isoform X2 [Tasmannia lanceolata]|uniref:biotin/lipoate A/B protein ligase family isoform X2 n=1 Tax=Tasmannia lanceolata TaxID=3420 RepID=UPI004062A92D